MLYKPKFCCNCGEKIERIDWNLLTSRRFCDVCFVENKRYDHLPRAAVAGGLLALVFGLGTIFGGKGGESVPIQTLNSSPARLKSGPAAPVQAEPASAPSAPPSSQVSNTSVSGPAAIASPAARKIIEPIHYCGALTKKGTPCSRKVKSAGQRCYQHEGKPAPPAD